MSETPPPPGVSETDPGALASAAKSVAGVLLPARQLPIGLGVGILAVIAIVGALYLARAFFVPLLIGILASYALRPIVTWLNALRIPRALGAALVLGTLIAGMSWTAVSLQDDAALIIEKLPGAARKARQQMSDAREARPTALQRIQETATELQGVAADAAGGKKTAKPTLPAVATSDWMRDYMLAQSALLFTVAAQTPIVLLLTYFLLASGDHFRRKLLQWVGPSLSRKKDAMRALEEIDTQIQRFLLATLGSNIVIAIVTWLALEALGMEQAGVWGVAAGLLHFIPYLGSVLFAIAAGMAAFTQFGTALSAFAVAGASMAVAIAVGSLIMTWLQSRFARVSAAVLFISLLFFGWLWGIWGLLLGAPLVAIAKVICDRVDSLKPVGDLLGK